MVETVVQKKGTGENQIKQKIGKNALVSGIDENRKLRIVEKYKYGKKGLQEILNTCNQRTIEFIEALVDNKNLPKGFIEEQIENIKKIDENMRYGFLKIDEIMLKKVFSHPMFFENFENLDQIVKLTSKFSNHVFEILFYIIEKEGNRGLLKTNENKRRLYNLFDNMKYYVDRVVRTKAYFALCEYLKNAELNTEKLKELVDIPISFKEHAPEAFKLINKKW